MKAFRDYNEVQAATEFNPIPAGGYIAVIVGAKVKEYKAANGSTFEKLEVAVDIAEGEFKDYYQREFNMQQTEDKKWKGVIRQFVPSDDGSEKDMRTKQYFKALIEAVEDSNDGYHWDWDERKLKGKKVGLLLRNEEWEFNGKTGWKAQPFKLVSVDKIRDGKFRVPQDKPLNNTSAPAAFSMSSGADFEEISDDDLPF